MWKLTPTKSYGISQKRYQKKHKRELAAVLNNLDTLLKAFQAGLKRLQATTAFGFVHPEPNGVVSIDQKGGGLNLAQTRLYAYPDEEKEVLYLITFGDKPSQAEDIKSCASFIKALRGGQIENYDQDIPDRDADGA